jgi:hypothetical protein
MTDDVYPTEHINRDKKLHVDMVFNRLNGLQKDLLDSRKGCDIECRTMQLGALTRLLNSTPLLNHSLEKDYRILSVGQLLGEVEAATCPAVYCLHHGWPHSGTVYKRHACPSPGNAFDVEIKSIADEVNKASQGLSITDYAVKIPASLSNGAAKAIRRKKRKGGSVMEGTPS